MRLLLSRFHRAFIIPICALAILAAARGQEPRAPETRPRDPNRGPWNSDLLLFSSHDGKTFDRPRTFVERAGVPCIIRATKDRLIAVFQWFPFHRPEAFDKVAVVFSENNGASWSQPEPITVDGLPDGAQRPFDPTLVLLKDGKLRLYFTCTTPARPLPGIYSAISDNGRIYRFEPGLRFGVDGEKVVDPAVARIGDTWHLYSPIEPHLLAADSPKDEEDRKARRPREIAGGYHAVSDDGLSFRRLEDVTVPVRGSWIGNVLSRGNELHFYGSGAGQGWLARSADGARWNLVSTALHVGGDPSAVQLSEGEFRLIATGPPRADGQRPPFLPQRPTPASRPLR
jgi:hypothetical protein